MGTVTCTGVGTGGTKGAGKAGVVEEGGIFGFGLAEEVMEAVGELGLWGRATREDRDLGHALVPG